MASIWRPSKPRRGIKLWVWLLARLNTRAINNGSTPTPLTMRVRICRAVALNPPAMPGVAQSHWKAF